MSADDIFILKGKIETLEKITDERWNSHDKRADERWSDLMDKLHEMERKFDNRPCSDHIKIMTSLSTKIVEHDKAIDGIIAKLWAVLLLVISAIITAVLSLFQHR